MAVSKRVGGKNTIIKVMFCNCNSKKWGEATVGNVISMYVQRSVLINILQQNASKRGRITVGQLITCSPHWLCPLLDPLGTKQVPRNGSLLASYSGVTILGQEIYSMQIKYEWTLEPKGTGQDMEWFQTQSKPSFTTGSHPKVMLSWEKKMIHPDQQIHSKITRVCSNLKQPSVAEAPLKWNLYNLPMAHRTHTFFIWFPWECQGHLICWLFEMCLLFSQD